MFLRNHFQNAYVTHNLDKAMKLVDDRFGRIDWIVFDPEMILQTPSGPKESSVRAALGWKAGLKRWIEGGTVYIPVTRIDSNRGGEILFRAGNEVLGMVLDPGMVGRHVVGDEVEHQPQAALPQPRQRTLRSHPTWRSSSRHCSPAPSSSPRR